MPIDLHLTPAEAMACHEIRRPEDMERLRQRSAGLAGKRVSILRTMKGWTAVEWKGWKS